MKNTKVHVFSGGGAILSVIVFAASLATASAGVCDRRIFSLRMLGDTNVNAKVDLAEIGNGMTVGDPSGWQMATRGNPATPLAGQDPIRFESARLPRAYWNNSATTNLQTFVVFPQTSVTVDNVISNAEQAITIPHAVDAERPLRSGFFRFRWDGYAFSTVENAVIFGDGWKWASADKDSTGYAFYIAPASGVNRLYIWVGGKATYVSGLEVSVGDWFDVAYRFLSSSSIEVTVRKNWTTTKTAVMSNLIHTLKFAPDENSEVKLVIGGQNEGAMAWKNDGETAPGRKVFKGAIAEFEIFDTTLSAEEMAALAAGQSGLEWMIGSVNGNSHEFDGDPQGVYDPKTMEWGKMRGKLTAESPTLTLRAKMRQNDGGRAKILSVVPLMDGVGASCPLSVTVNGQPVKALCGNAVDMASANSRDIFIPGQLWVADANGDVTVELTRQAPVSGTLAFDALTLSGSWQVGTVGNGADEFCHERYCPEVFFVEDADVTNHVRKATYPSTSSSPSGLFLRSWLPERAAENCKAHFAMRISNAQSAAAFLFKVLVGDSVVWSGTVVKGDTIAFDIPCGTFSSGYNDVSVQNCSTESTFWAQYDYFRLDFKPISGMRLIFR